MLLNNLDPEVAEHPERLVVYGGSGRAARSHDALRAIVRTLLRLGDDETLLVQSGQAGRRLPDARGRAARADRELAARAALGDLGRVPPPRGRGADDVRPDDGGELDLHRHPGDPPGHLPDVRRGRREALRLAGPRRPDDPDGRARAAWAVRSRSRRRWPARRSSASRSIRRVWTAGSRRATSTRRPTRSTTRSRGSARQRRSAARCRSACSANAADVVPELAARGERFDLVTDQTAAHDPLTGYVPPGLSVEEAARAARARSGRVPARARDVDRRPRPRRCWSSSGQAAMFSIMATTCEGRPMKRA